MSESIRACRICGCTESNACVDDRTKQPCHWVADDLCSNCVAVEALIEREVLAKGISLGDALEEWKEINGAPVTDELEAFAVFMFGRGFDAAVSFAEAVQLVEERDIFAPLEPTAAGRDLRPETSGLSPQASPEAQ